MNNKRAILEELGMNVLYGKSITGFPYRASTPYTVSDMENHDVMVWELDSLKMPWLLFTKEIFKTECSGRKFFTLYFKHCPFYIFMNDMKFTIIQNSQGEFCDILTSESIDEIFQNLQRLV